jgi:SAM-dependent methyltransferase
MSDAPFQVRPTDPAPASCKLCGGVARLFGVIDFNRNCEEIRGKFLPPAGIPIPYRRCDRRFDLVTCFETLEHMPDPTRGAADIAALLKPDGLLLFSTLVQPADFDAQGMQWWYIGPRNGHVTLHSRASLTALWAGQGLQLASFNDNMHTAFRTLPPFAQHLMPSAAAS